MNPLEMALHGVIGERPKNFVPERLSKKGLLALTEKFEEDSRKAFHISSFPERNETVVDAVTTEAITSARHFGMPFMGVKGPWQQQGFWKEIQQVLRSAVRASSSAFASAFDKDGRPDTTPEGKAAYKAAYDEPGPAAANRAYLMEVMARLEGPYAHTMSRVQKYFGDSEGNEERERIAAKVDRALEQVDMYAVVDFVLDELKRAGMGDIPSSRSMLKVNKEVYARLEDIVPSDDYFRKPLLQEEALKVHPSPRSARDDLFLRLALTGAHATWEAAQIHRDVYDDTMNRSTRDDYTPLPTYLRKLYTTLIDEEISPEDAVLRVAYDLYKDVYILRQENRAQENRISIPEPWMFSSHTDAEKPDKKIPFPSAGVTAMAVIAGATGVANLETPTPTHEPLKQERYEVAPNVASSELARISQGNGAIELLTSLLENTHRVLEYREQLKKDFGFTDDMSARERADALARILKLYQPGTGSALIFPGDRFEYGPDKKITLVHLNGERLSLDATHPYTGLLDTRAEVR